MSNGPVHTFGFVEDLPKKQTSTKRTKLEDTYRSYLETLKDNPAKWAKLATGKTVTITRTRARLAQVYGSAGFEFATRKEEGDGQASLFGRFVKPSEESQQLELFS